MLYSKLEVVLLSVIASKPQDSQDAVLATYLLEHVDALDDVTIQALADHCHVGLGSVSRFCRHIGFQDFFELRACIQAHNTRYRNDGEKNNVPDPAVIERVVRQVDERLDPIQLEKLARNLKTYRKIAVFGLLKGQAACLAFAQEMLAWQKVVYTNLSLFEQIEYFKKADENTLVVVFSYTGSYFDYVDVRSLRAALERPKIWMVSGCRKPLDFVDEWLVFNSDLQAAGHPYQLLRAGENIAAWMKKED